MPNRKLNNNYFAEVCIFISVKIQAHFSILLRYSLKFFVWQQRSYVFFGVARLGYAFLFIKSAKKNNEERTVSMKKRRIASALLSGAMLMSMCCFGASATESENDVIIFGDLNLDSSVNLLDAITSQKYIINSITLDDITAVDESLLDINKDGTINLLDAIALQKHLVNLDVKEYIGKIVYEWVPAGTAVTKTVHHDAVTEEVPVYKTYGFNICNQCGADVTDVNVLVEHYLDSDTCISYHCESRTVQVGTETKVVKDAWDEVVVTIIDNGYWEHK